MRFVKKRKKKQFIKTKNDAKKVIENYLKSFLKDNGLDEDYFIAKRKYIGIFSPLPKRRVISIETELANGVYNLAWWANERPEAILDKLLKTYCKKILLNVRQRPEGVDQFSTRYHLTWGE